MVGIVEFLNARLDEDEQAARYAGAEYYEEEFPAALPAHRHARRHDPARVLREITAKRAVMERHHEVTEDHENSWMWSWYDAQRGVSQACVGCGWSGDPDMAVTDRIEDCDELRDMASVYADHEDYDHSWA